MRSIPIVCLLAIGICRSHSALSGPIIEEACSGNVAIPPDYNNGPAVPNVQILSRDANGETKWSPAFNVQPSDDGDVRWWCKSTTGNIIDPGTWTITDFSIGEVCEEVRDQDGNEQKKCGTNIHIEFGSSALGEWTPERTTCDSTTTRIRARLGKHRILQIDCLGDLPPENCYQLCQREANDCFADSGSGQGNRVCADQHKECNKDC